MSRANLTTTPFKLDEALRWIEAWLVRQPGSRLVLGLVGAPGAGKSTLCEALHQGLAQSLGPAGSVVVPMDGFHLAQAELERLGLAHRKGAPDTFDAWGYVHLLKRLRQAEALRSTVYAPQFRRDWEEPVAGAIAVRPDHRVVFTEGNYLLLDESPWLEVRAQLDAAWFVQGNEAVRRERLIRRHEHFGRTRRDAEQWVASSDDVNARLVNATRERADALIEAP